MGSMSHQTKIVHEGVKHKEIEFVCANPNHCDSTHPQAQENLHRDLKKISGVIPLKQDWSHLESGQKSLSVIYKHPEHKKQIMQLAKKHGVGVDIERHVSDDYVDKAIRGEHEGQVNEQAEDEHLYHVTHTKHIAKIQKQGLHPMQTSNWVKAGDKERYGSGEVYTFTHKDDAHQWAGRMDWAHHQKLGSGNISIVTVKKPKDHKFEVDTNDPLSQAGQKGKWLKTQSSIPAHHIVGVEKYVPKKLGEDKIAAFYHDTQLQNVRMKETGVKRKKRQKDPRPIEFRRKDLKGFRESVESKANSEWIEKVQLDKVPAKKKKLPVPQDMPVQSGSTPIVGEKIEQKGHDMSDSKKLDEISAKKLRDYVYAADDQIRRGDIKKRIKRSKGIDKALWKLGLKGHINLASVDEDVVLEATYHARVIAHPAVADVDHGGPGDYFVNLKKGWHLGDGSRSFGNESPKHAWKMLKHATQKDYKKWVTEDVANSVGGGNIAGMPTKDTPETSVARPIGKGKVERRKKFAGKTVFVVDPHTFHNAYLGKRKYEHYEKYLEGCDIADEIREFGRTNWAEPIIIENEITGAMVYLKYGSK
jgi:hypothetical protein